LSPVTHFLLSWAIADAARLPPRACLAVALAGVAPDLDGLGLVVDLGARAFGLPDPDWYGRAHHVLLHGLPGALLIAGVTLVAMRHDAATAAARWQLAFWLLVAVHLHLACDLLGSGGPQHQHWPIAYLSPISAAPAWAWSGQWPLNGWQNLALSAVLIAWVGLRAARSARSPLELLAPRLHAVFVAAVQRRLGHPA
jgi:hypothetical protein